MGTVRIRLPPTLLLNLAHVSSDGQELSPGMALQEEPGTAVAKLAIQETATQAASIECFIVMTRV